MTDKILYEKIFKNKSDVNLWFAYPGTKGFAYSSLGYMYLYKYFDQMPSVNFEPIFADTKKTKIMAKDIDLCGFSFSFDLDFINILNILNQHNIPLKSSQRKENDPLIFGGGPVLTANPEPYHEIFDFVIIGDGEDVFEQIITLYRENKSMPREKLLEQISELDGVYVPTNPKKIKKLTCKNLKIITTPILSEESFFPNTFVIEIERGCSNRCGFCVASYINLPIRFLEYEEIIKNIDLGLQYTNKIALLGAMIAAHPKFDKICEYIYNKVQQGENIELSFSSLRADNIIPIAIKTLAACGQKHSTIAIEAASERLRKVINKNLTEEQIFNCVKICQENGLKGLKIYAMIGLPTETQEDIDEFIALGTKLKNAFKGFHFSFAFSTFVPKPHTPFQWCKREDLKSLKTKQNYLKKEFHKIGLSADFSSAKWDYFQSVLSNGGREISDIIFEIYENGGTASAYQNSIKKLKPCESSLETPLPWDFISMTPPKEFLKSEYKNLLKL
ncbi:radical SAM protein [bacterium]|nr:radical SAM protein [bacterium]